MSCSFVISHLEIGIAKRRPEEEGEEEDDNTY